VRRRPPDDEWSPADRPPRRRPGELAAEVLAALWSAGTALTASEVQARLGTTLAYSTVVTILSRLHAKHVLEREQQGRAYAYRPVSDEPGMAARRMRQVLDAESNRENVLARFVSTLSDEDEQVLRRLLREPPPDAAGRDHAASVEREPGRVAERGHAGSVGREPGRVAERDHAASVEPEPGRVAERGHAGSVGREPGRAAERDHAASVEPEPGRVAGMGRDRVAERESGRANDSDRDRGAEPEPGSAAESDRDQVAEPGRGGGGGAVESDRGRSAGWGQS
jgi:predicted transcriptional regulator